MTESHHEGVHDPSLLAVYATLFARCSSNSTLQWQVPAFVLASQGALLAGVLVTTGALALSLGVGSAVFGGAGALAMRRIELTARWDRELLDEYEKRLLVNDEDLRLHHDAVFPERLRLRPLSSSRSKAKRFELALLRLTPPSLIVMLLMIGLGLVCIGAGLSR